MQDQVAQLRQMGISAALLNSTLQASAQGAILREADRGTLPAAVSFAGAIGAC